jgi:hypothetical protein
MGNTKSIIKHLSQQRQPLAMHKHHPVHELHAMQPTGFHHLLQISHARRTGLFADHMLPGLGGADNPFLAKTRGQRDVNRHVYGPQRSQHPAQPLQGTRPKDSSGKVLESAARAGNGN